MIKSGVKKELIEPIWTDRNGCECKKEASYGRKVNHTITYPEMCIVGNEVGANTSQKDDGHKGGKNSCSKKIRPSCTCVNQRLSLYSYGANCTH